MAVAQNGAPNTCIAPREIKAADLFGHWTLELATPAIQSARFSLKQNPDFEGSLAGAYVLNRISHEVFGDVEGGDIEWEETTNGKDPSALWKGHIPEDSCGKTIIGTRQSVTLNGDSQVRGELQAFTLRRSGW